MSDQEAERGDVGTAPNPHAWWEKVTEYTYSMLPEDSPPGSSAWWVKAEYRGHDLWAVTNVGRCLTTDGEWDYEVQPSSREDDWLATHRFTESDAKRWAQKMVPTIVWNGLTVADLLERIT